MKNEQRVEIVVSVCFKHRRLITSRAYFYNGVFISYISNGVGSCERCAEEAEKSEYKSSGK